MIKSKLFLLTGSAVLKQLNPIDKKQHLSFFKELYGQSMPMREPMEMMLFFKD